MQQDLAYLLEQQVEKEFRQKGFTVSTGRYSGGSNDLVIHYSEEKIGVVECKLNRNNLKYAIGQLLQMREWYTSIGEADVQLILAMPKSEINSTVQYKCKEANIELYPVDFDLPIPQRRSFNIKLSEDHDVDLVDWLKDVPSGRVQTVIKKALRDYLKMRSDNTQEVLMQIQKDIEQIKTNLEKPQKGGEKHGK